MKKSDLQRFIFFDDQIYQDCLWLVDNVINNVTRSKYSQIDTAEAFDRIMHITKNSRLMKNFAAYREWEA